MTMSRKGIRKINVDDVIYKYIIRREGDSMYSPLSHSDIRVTVEVPTKSKNPNYITKYFEEVLSVTPKDVELFIRKTLKL